MEPYPQGLAASLCTTSTPASAVPPRGSAAKKQEGAGLCPAFPRVRVGAERCCGMRPLPGCARLPASGVSITGCCIRPTGSGHSCAPALPRSSYSSSKTVARKPGGNETCCERGKPVSLINGRSNALQCNYSYEIHR